MDSQLEQKSQEPIEQSILNNLLAIGRIVGNRGQAHRNTPNAHIRNLDSAPTRPRYSARVDLETFTENPYIPPSIQVCLDGKPKPGTEPAISNTDIFVKIDPKQNAVLIVDIERLPEAQNFEEPTNVDGWNILRSIVNNKIEIRSPLTNLGPKTKQFLLSFSQDALQSLTTTSHLPTTTLPSPQT